MDPFGLATGIVGLISVALKLVVGTLGMIDKTCAAHDEAANELEGLEQDLKQLQTQMIRIHGVLDVLASNTKDRGFKKLLRNDRGQAAIRDLCKALEMTLSMLTQMTDKMKEDDLRPAPLPSDKKSLEFIRAVLKHSIKPSQITDLVRALQKMRSDVQTCLTKLEATFQYVRTLYDMMSNGLARITSGASLISTSTNSTIRIKLAAWLKGWEGTWGPFKQRESISLHDFLQSQPMTVAEDSHMTDDLVAGNSHFLQFEHVTGEPSHITDDLLGMIFDHLCERGPLSLRHLLFVSRRFYSVIVNNANLWTTISLDSSFFWYFHQQPEQGNIFVEHCLIRSGLLPLCLYIDTSDMNAHKAAFLLLPLKTFGKPKWRGFARCISLTWIVNDDATTTTQTFVDLLPKSLPSLKHISITNFGDPIGGSQIPNCPVLERVEMLRNQTRSVHFWGANLQHVTTLSFGNYDTWTVFDLTTLSLFPVLRDLTLFTVNRLRYQVPVRSPPVIFENLRTLRTRGRIQPAFPSQLVAPVLEELYLEANTENITSLYALQTSFNPLCQCINALLPEAVSAEEPKWATNLLKLVLKCTRIKSLYISKWMEEECRERLSGHGVVLHV